MIKFEKDNYIMYFDCAETAAEWLVEQHEKGGDFDIISDYYDEFEYWLNDRYTAYEILKYPTDYSLEEIHEQWLYYIVCQVENCYDEFEEISEEDED